MATDTDAIVRRAMAQALTSLLPLLPNLDKFQAVSTCIHSGLLPWIVLGLTAPINCFAFDHPTVPHDWLPSCIRYGFQCTM